MGVGLSLNATGHFHFSGSYSPSNASWEVHKSGGTLSPQGLSSHKHMHILGPIVLEDSGPLIPLLGTLKVLKSHGEKSTLPTWPEGGDAQITDQGKARTPPSPCSGLALAAHYAVQDSGPHSASIYHYPQVT